MLLKNDEVFKLTEEQKQDVLKKFSRFPVVLNYHKSKTTWDAENKRYRKADTLAIQTTAPANINGSYDNYTWAKNVKRDQNGNLVSTPTMLLIKGGMVIDKTEIELLWWLYNCAPKISNNAKKAQIPYFEFEQKEKAAQQSVNLKRKTVAVQKLIFDVTDGISDEHLKQIAESFKIDTNTISLDEIRNDLEAQVIANDNNYNLFIDRVKALKEGVSELVENIVQEAIENKVIGYQVGKFAYNFLKEDGEVGPLFTKLRAVKTELAQEELVKVLYQNNKLVKLLKEEMEVKI